MRAIISLILPALLLSGCGEFQQQRRATPADSRAALPQPAPPAGARNQILQVAASLLGTPYKYGGISPSGFDCSGFTAYVFRQAGIGLPRTAAAQYKGTRRILRADLGIGDLVFFRIDSHKISHVAIYAGDNKFIHAPASGKHVTIDSLDNPYWQQHWIGNGRAF